MKTVLIIGAAVAALSLQSCDKATADKAATVATPAAVAATDDPTPITIDGETLKIGGATPATIALGTAKAQVLAAFTAAIGSPPVVSDRFEECGAGPMDHSAWDNGLELLFQDNKLGGWQTRNEVIADAKGIHVGSTLAELQAAWPDAVLEEDTIGWYFTAGGYGGYLDETKSFIQRIDVGVTCDAT